MSLSVKKGFSEQQAHTHTFTYLHLEACWYNHSVLPMATEKLHWSRWWLKHPLDDYVHFSGQCWWFLRIVTISSLFSSCEMTVLHKWGEDGWQKWFDSRLLRLAFLCDPSHVWITWQLHLVLNVVLVHHLLHAQQLQWYSKTTQRPHRVTVYWSYFA